MVVTDVCPHNESMKTCLSHEDKLLYETVLFMNEGWVRRHELKPTG